MPTAAHDENARVLQARVFSIGMALSCASWVVLGLLHASPEDRWTAGRLGIACLHATTAVLFALRVPAKEMLKAKDIFAALPSLALSGALFRLAPPPSQWPLWVNLVFVVATAWTVWSLGTLGRSFAFFPARRELVTSGPFSLVRHPAYLGELVMTSMFATTALSSAQDLPRAALVGGCALVLIPAVVWRVRAEDAVMAEAPNGAAYQASTRFRLIPFVF